VLQAALGPENPIEAFCPLLICNMKLMASRLGRVLYWELVMPKLSNMASYAMVMGVIGVMGYVHGIYNQLNQLPMTDPWCWYINANIKGVY